MAKSKINQEDAAEWLATLQLSGEGWYRNLALAIKADAHKVLGMDRREFAAQVGQRMIDPRDAIVELHQEGHSETAIADMLGVSRDRTVARVLTEEGLREPPDRPKWLTEGDATDDEGVIEGDATDVEVEADELRRKVEVLSTRVEREQQKRHDAIEKEREKAKKVREDLKAAKQKLLAKEREERDEQLSNLTEEEKERARKEAEVWAEEHGRKIIASLAHLGVQGIVADLEHATEQLSTLIPEGGLDANAVGAIEAAYVTFTEEFNVARAAALDNNPT